VMRMRLHSIAVWIPLAVLLAPNLALGQTPSEATSPAFTQGLADRQACETWFAGLSGQYKAGAEFWAGQRSLPNPAGCYAAGGRDLGAWSEGCVAAQRLLGPSDARRKSEPEYRLGWNSLNPSPEKPSKGRIIITVDPNLKSPPPAQATDPYADADYAQRIASIERASEEAANIAALAYTAQRCRVISPSEAAEINFNASRIPFNVWEASASRRPSIPMPESSNSHALWEQGRARSDLSSGACDYFVEHPEVVFELRQSAAQ